MYVKRKDLLLIASGYNIFIVLIFACCVTAKLFPVLRCGAEVTLAEHASKQNTAPSVLSVQFMVSYKQSIHLGNLPQQLQFIDMSGPFLLIKI